MADIQQFDVVVVGAGAGGMLSAIRAHDLGLRAIVIEKSLHLGGTSALSGGQMWIPNHPLMKGDTKEAALQYLRQVTHGEAHEERLVAFLDNGPEMLTYLKSLGIELVQVSGWPDYFSEFEGASQGRSVVPAPIRAETIGDDFYRLREQPLMWKLFNRIAMDTDDLAVFGLRLPGWRKRLLSRFAAYWLDLSWRRRSRRDRRLTLGNTLVGGLLRALRSRDIPILLNTSLVELVRQDDTVVGCLCRREGVDLTLHASRGVILAAGGFEHNQALRQHYLGPAAPIVTFTPATNTGDAIDAAVAIGAGVEWMDQGFWVPAVRFPIDAVPNSLVPFGLFRLPHSLCVDGDGARFLNEAASYDKVGNDMVARFQQRRTRFPTWFIFDNQYRQKFGCGGLMPSGVMPDRKVPPQWWDSYVYRGETIEQLARKIAVDPLRLKQSVDQINAAAASGSDDLFGRGSTLYDRLSNGDPTLSPNPGLGTVERGPFYAVRMELGDLGLKGGLRVDGAGAVLRDDGARIEGLYAIGDTASAIFAREYPGPGSSLGPGLTGAYVVAGELSKMSGGTAEVQQKSFSPVSS